MLLKSICYLVYTDNNTTTIQSLCAPTDFLLGTIQEYISNEIIIDKKKKKKK